MWLVVAKTFKFCIGIIPKNNANVPIFCEQEVKPIAECQFSHFYGMFPYVLLSKSRLGELPVLFSLLKI